MFINYDHTTDTLTIDSFRKPNAAAGDIMDLVAAITAKDESICYSGDFDAALAATEDGSIWKDEEQQALEDLHHLINSHDYPGIHRDDYYEEN